VSRLILMLVLLLGVALPGTAEADARKSYRVTYRLTLVGAPPNVTLEGRSQAVHVRRCENWAERGEIAFTIQSGGRPAASVVHAAGGEEAADGTSLNWSTQMTVNGQRSEFRSNGTVAMAGKGGKVQTMNNGVPRTVDLPDGAYFPGAGMTKVVSELAAGKTSISIRMFQAGMKQDVLEHSFTVVPSPFSAAPPPLDPAGLTRGPSWIVKVAHGLEPNKGTESYMQLHANGLTSRMLVNMGGLMIEFAVASVEPVPDMSC
jgi:hypothetical protein